MSRSKIHGLAAATALAAALAAAAPFGSAWAAHRSEAEHAIAAAKAAAAKAQAAGIGTKEADDLIGQAKALLPSRQYTQAIELATKAKQQVQQAGALGAAKGPTQAASPAPQTAAKPAAAEAPAGGAAKAAEVEPTKTAPGPQTATAAEAQEAIDAAEAARKKAASVDGEWRDTQNLIKDAEKLAKDGEYDKAVKLAGEAKRQGEYGYAQAEAEKNADFPPYMLHKKP